MSSAKDTFDSEVLISEVEKRPASFNIQLPEYSDRNSKNKLWDEVCGALFENWGQLEGDTKIEKS